MVRRAGRAGGIPHYELPAAPTATRPGKDRPGSRPHRADADRRAAGAEARHPDYTKRGEARRKAQRDYRPLGAGYF